MPEFVIDPDISQAATLPSRFYTDEQYFEQSKERIFVRCWQFLGQKNEVAGLDPQILLPGFLDEPILLSRSAE